MAAAAGMLAEMPVAALTLSELSRRVGLAKSNVLRYFESREDVLLEVLMRSAAVYARVLAARPEVLDLLSAQAAVLERNVSTEAVVRFKRAAIAGIDAMAAVLTRAVPELGEAAPSACATILTLSGALYTQAEQSGACESAYLVAPELAALRTELVPALHGAVATIVAGTLARG